jgi:hypothetical protein
VWPQLLRAFCSYFALWSTRCCLRIIGHFVKARGEILLNRHSDMFEESLLCMLATVIELLACIFMFWGACFESLPKYYFKVFTFFSSDCLCRSWHTYSSPPPSPFAQQPTVSQSLLIVEASRSLSSDTPHSEIGRVISPTQRPLPDDTQHSKEADMQDPGGIRTHNPSKRAAAVIGVRPQLISSRSF